MLDYILFTSGGDPIISRTLGTIFKEWQNMKMITISKEILANLQV